MEEWIKRWEMLRKRGKRPFLIRTSISFTILGSIIIILFDTSFLTAVPDLYFPRQWASLQGLFRISLFIVLGLLNGTLIWRRNEKRYKRYLEDNPDNNDDN